MMNKKKKWITYGVAGALGLSLVGGAAAATAANMDLRTGDGSVVPGGPVVGSSGDVLDRDTVKMRATDTSASVISTPSVNSAPSRPSPVSVVSAPSPVAPAPAPAPVDSPPSPASVPSPDSPPSPASVASAGSD
ncbi:hypothetical protein ACFC3F_14740 [Microbacterium sp. NPDC055910]|uniref:hypothetical protein n=1 Tax=Microbacterium sp. NPDC055910 TaxID=3345659 RepID=UPI0035D6B4A4